MRAVLACLLFVLLGGCASTLPSPPAQTLWRDAAFAPPVRPVDPREAMALSPAMQQFVREELVPRVRASGGSQRVLVTALHSRRQLRLEYDATITRTAAQAFDARAGNCLSLVLMTAAIAQELGMPVRYNRAVIDDVWSRGDGLYFLNGHVNLTLGRRMNDAAMRYDSENRLTVDFLPPEELQGLRTVEISESTVLAMFLNNRAAEHLSAGALDEAYWHARAAILQEPGYGAAYNTLGVIYLRRGLADAAESSFRHLLAQQPQHREALANLVGLLQRAGPEAEAQPLRQMLAALEAVPPFHHFERGVAAMQQGRHAVARELFGRELRRSPDYHEFHFWYGLASLALGDEVAAGRHLALAAQHSTSSQQHARYTAKLQALQAAREGRRPG